MLARVYSMGLHGFQAYKVIIELDERCGLPRSLVVGNASANVREALERVIIALKNTGAMLPPRRVTVNLAPADIRKEGNGFDLPMLVGLIQAFGFAAGFSLEDTVFVGELGLDGSVKPVRGILPMAACALKEGFRAMIVPQANLAEARLTQQLQVIGIGDVQALLALLSSEQHFHSRLASQPMGTDIPQSEPSAAVADFSDICGQNYGIRAAMLAAAGGHSLLLSGPAGCGKTMIAQRMAGILPPMSREEALELSEIYSVSGLLSADRPLLCARPFRAPHHSASVQVLLGGSGPMGVIPGELALASKGILFLDELPLFSAVSTEALRQPLEEGIVRIQRLRGSISYRLDCMLVAAMNPCPCGFYPDRRCRCKPAQIRQYQRGLSRPLLQRIDICAELNPVQLNLMQPNPGQLNVMQPNPGQLNVMQPNPEQLNAIQFNPTKLNESPRAKSGQLNYMQARAAGQEREKAQLPAGTDSAALRRSVLYARARQQERFGAEGKPQKLNAQMNLQDLERYCTLGAAEGALMYRLFQSRGLSMRSYHKTLRLARTIADVAGEQTIQGAHLIEALSYRGLEEKLYGG